MTMCISRVFIFAALILWIDWIDAVKIRHSGGKHALQRRFQGHGLQSGPSAAGLWPSVFNVATKASITANATCGTKGREEFCRLAEHGRSGRCGICDASATDPGKRHPIENAIDGSNRWWQSPSLFEGLEYEQVDITLDLKQVYQVVYVIVKSGNAPRPGSWILERSLDGINYYPWQYYAINDDECLQEHGIPATPREPKYVTDTDVICTSYYSKLHPMENGEIHTSLIHGRPGANDSSPELLAFTRARFVRLRLLRHRASVSFPGQSGNGNLGVTPAWHHFHHGTPAFAKRLYYAIRDISIGGQCVCSGHAKNCRHNVASGHPECECEHHTCGAHCDRCCPLFNQRPWGPGSARDARPCEQCQCHGHAKHCIYDEAVEAAGLSVDIHGKRRGGGVCLNCTDFTTGVNCEKCLPGFFRPDGIPPDAKEPCIPCPCSKQGTVNNGECVQEPVEEAGKCLCKPGYAGLLCDRCAAGYKGYPNCHPCPCDPRGTVPSGDCELDCLCKANVEGERCDVCKPGYFSLRGDNFEGCSACFCSGVTNVCESAFLTTSKVDTLEDWQISDISVTQTIRPYFDAETNWISVGNYELPGIEAYYYLAPSLYTGNQLKSYSSDFEFQVNWVVMRGDTSGKPTTGPNIILIGSNGLRIAHGDATYTGTNATLKVTIREANWYHIPYGVKDIVTRLKRTEYRGDPVTRFQFMSVLSDLKHLLVRAKFHTDQIEGSLEDAAIMPEEGAIIGAGIEKCACPNGYTGLSCESCDYGYVRRMMNTTTHLEQGICVKCNCNGHSPSCDSETSGNCQCEHNTVGENCERCAPGHYGNPLAGTPEDCKACACPLEDPNNNFSPSCQMDPEANRGYVCTQCPMGYTGDHCEICDYGYFGSPTTPGKSCQPCTCGGGPCDRVTGQCLSCRGNTEGWRCEKCKAHHYGDAATANCHPCECDPVGSMSQDCDSVTGQCQCKERFTGRTCDRCESGYGNVTAECPICTCNSLGAISNICDSVSGLCQCKPGVEGFRCDACQHLHYGFSEEGCLGCACNSAGSELPTCDIVSGQCRCKIHVIGRNCDACEVGFWGLDSGRGCFKCECDSIGSVNGACDQKTKQCHCKPGIGGLKCDTCLPGFFGFSNTGCKACEYCIKPGHVCDPDTGRCVCPTNTRGEACEKCIPNSYGHEFGRGCKSCNCASHGSIRKQCDIISGECECKKGYTGTHCDKCAYGYFGYPRCRKCDCDRAGTEPEYCLPNGLCSCDETGQCACKANVVGKKCNECSNGTFGLHLDNPAGCTQCFCFGRTAHCTESNLTIGHVRLNTSREFEIETVFKKQVCILATLTSVLVVN